MKKSKYNNINRQAFTLVEVMLLLVVLSLIMASSFSLITRKHNLKPRRASHGQYICFYEQNEDGSNGVKHEILVSGKTVIKNQRGMEKCVFDVPKSSSYIHVRMLGGGGAGGNANYSPVRSENNNFNGPGESMPIKDSNKINLISTIFATPFYQTDFSGKDIMPRITTGKQEWDKNWKTFAEYHCAGTECGPYHREHFFRLPMGVTPSYVEHKFLTAPSAIYGPYCNFYKNGGCDVLFSRELFLYLVRNYFVEKVFAYDYGGSGASGSGISFKAFDYSKSKVYSDGTTDFKTAYWKFIQTYPQNRLCQFYATDTDASLPNVIEDPNNIDPATGKPVESRPDFNKTVKYDSNAFKSINLTTGKLLEYCPLFFKYYVPQSVQKTCSGSTGGYGSIFATDLIDYDFYVYPILGWRWGNTAHTGGSDQNVAESFYNNPNASPPAALENILFRSLTMNNSGEPESPISDRWVFRLFGSNDSGAARIRDKYIKDVVMNNNVDWGKVKDFVIYSPTIASSSPAPGVRIGEETLVPPVFDAAATVFGWKKLNDSYLQALSIPAVLNAGGFDNSKLEYTLPSAYTGTLLPEQGGIPVFWGGKTGVALHHGGDEDGGGNVTEPSVSDAGGYIRNVSDTSVIGTSGTLHITKAMFNKDTLWKDDGAFNSCPSSGSSSYNGTDGTSSVTSTNQILCVKNLGLLLKNPNIKQVLNATGADYQCMNKLDANYTPYMRAFKHNKGTSYTFPEDQIALNLSLNYFYKSMSYGMPGKSGEYTEFFTRSYKSNEINVIPGSGGIATELDSKEVINNAVRGGNYSAKYQRVAPTDGQHGGKTIVYYNCEIDNAGNQYNCATREVAGGVGGYSGLWEEKTYNRYKGSYIYNLLNPSDGDYPKLVKCSITAPHKFGCPEPSDENKARFGVTNANAFLEAAPLLSLPEVPGLNLETLGSGGAGGWVVDNCWFTPQYFQFPDGRRKGLSEILNSIENGTNNGILKNIDALDDHKGYTAILPDDVSACKSNYISFGTDADEMNATTSDPEGLQYYYEEQGKDGVSGAVLIMW